MASTDTRSGFRLPWSSDRSHEDTAPETAAEETTKPAETEATATAPEETAWPTTDPSAAPGQTGIEQRPFEAEGPATPDAEEPAAMVELDTAVAQAPATPAKKPSKLMADLTAAIRGTAEAAREQALSQADADVKQVVDAIRERSTEGAVALKNQSEEDIASIREWSKAEIARIREETESRITGRKATLEEELAGHAAAVERRVEEVRAELARFESDMESYVERLLREDDPARLATMAETMPETPTFESWADLGDLDITLVPEPEAPVAEVAEVVEVVEPAADPVAAAFDPWAPAPVGAEPSEAAASPETTAEAAIVAVDPWGEPQAVTAAPEAVEVDEVVAEPDPELTPEASAAPAVSGWGDGAWGDVDSFAAASTPDVSGDVAAAGEPADRGAIMAALEAAAEAVVAAESAATSADQAEAAADVAETAAELLVARSGSEGELAPEAEDAGDQYAADAFDPEAQAAIDARLNAGGFETESFQDRLASLLPGRGEGSVDDEPRTTQVVVSGLVSVASIASFKRHLARLAGVQNVAVASGPEGEFVFNLTHRADLSFRDAIPTMPGFAARVTSTGDGVVTVTARDPESEG